MKFNFRAVFAIFIFFLTSGLASDFAFADVKVAEDRIKNLEKFETWRAETCVEAQIDWQRSSKNNKNRKVKEITDILEVWCPMDGTVMYLIPAITKACKDDKRNLADICRKLARVDEDEGPREAVFFTGAFDELMLFTQAVPWKTVGVKNEIANFAGVTTLQRGNLSVEITAELIALDKAGYSEAELAVFTGYLAGLELNLERDGILYVPFMNIQLYALGLTNKNVYLDITSVMDDEGRNPINLASDDERISGRDPFNYFLPLSAGNIDHFTNSHAFRITGYKNAKKTKPLYEFTLPTDGFADVMKELLAHYRGL